MTTKPTVKDLPDGAVLALKFGEGDLTICRVLQRDTHKLHFREGEFLCYRIFTSSWIGKRNELDLANPALLVPFRWAKSPDSDPYICWITAESLPIEYEILDGLIPPTAEEIETDQTKMGGDHSWLGHSWDYHQQYVRRKLWWPYALDQKKKKEKEIKKAEREAKKLAPKVAKNQIRVGPPSGNFVIHPSRVLWRGDEIKDADAESFRELTPRWGVDKSRAYADGKISTAIPLAKLRVLNAIFISDGSAIYLGAEPIPNVDALTFECLDAGVRCIERIFAESRFGGYARDAKRLYYADAESNTFNPITGADRDSFHPLMGGFAVDASNAFWLGEKIEGARIQMWHQAGNDYSSDAESVFFRTKRLAGIGVRNFQVYNLDGEALASDGERYLHGDSEISRDAWNAIVRDRMTHIAVMLREKFGVKAELKSPV